jgi:NAD+ kinase
MKIALFGREISPAFAETFQLLINSLEKNTSTLLVYEDFYNHITKFTNFKKPVKSFKSRDQLDHDTLCLISIGGDGTLLDTITIIQDSEIPVLGINTGRLGFLSSVAAEEIPIALDALFSGNYTLDKRSLLELITPEGLFGSVNYALNELTVLKRDNSSMITISAYIDDMFLNTYWADGLIVATPTGSTGYSLSCGGPIISPGSKNLIITPIATHNLTVRPIVVPDISTIRLTISGRTQDFLVTLDSRSKPLSTSVELVIKKARFSVNLMYLGHKDFYKTIRNKLAWGLDIRN